MANNSPYIDGSAFHLYGGTIDALTQTYNATQKNIYFTERNGLVAVDGHRVTLQYTREM